MDPILLMEQLAALMASLYQEGLLDDGLQQIRSLEEQVNPNFITNRIAIFSDDVERLLRALQKSLKEADVDYERNKVCSTELSLHCARIGAPSMQLAAANFLLFCENNDIRGCKKAYSKLEAEFFCLRAKLEVMVKLEQQIKLSGRRANK